MARRWNPKANPDDGPVAQLVEQLPLKQLVVRSSRTGLTKILVFIFCLRYNWCRKQGVL